MKALTASIWKRYFPRKPFSSSEYWSQRYESGRNSGPGSYGPLREFKAAILNTFVAKNGVTSIIEFGCGDGNQLSLAQYPAYIGYDVSSAAVAMCRNRFAGDASKQFFHIREYVERKAELTMSLDVIFHLVEDDVFDEYMRRLFGAASKFVVVYSSNQNEPIEPVVAHVRHRRFSEWIEQNAPRWSLTTHVPNPYPYNGDSTTTSFADFYFYQTGQQKKLDPAMEAMETPQHRTASQG